MQGTELVPVDFYGDSILAARIDDGRVVAAVKRICEALGLGYASQYQKLKGHDWSGITMIVTPDSRGSPQETCVIPVENIPLWMVTIAANRVAENIRPKLKAYQKEAAQVLARHFLGSPAEPTPPAEPTGLALEIRNAKQLVAILERQADQEQRYAEQEVKLAAIEVLTDTRLAAIEAKADAALAGTGNDTGFLSLMGFCKLHKIRLSAADMKWHGSQISAHCKTNGIKFGKAFHEVYSHVNVYPIEVLERWAVRNHFVDRTAYATMLLARCRSLDVRLWVEDDRIQFDAPKGALDNVSRIELVHYKAELMTVIRQNANDPALAGPKHGLFDARRNHEQH
jgi:hypothetical protein